MRRPELVLHVYAMGLAAVALANMGARFRPPAATSGSLRLAAAHGKRRDERLPEREASSEGSSEDNRFDLHHRYGVAETAASELMAAHRG